MQALDGGVEKRLGKKSGKRIFGTSVIRFSATMGSVTITRVEARDLRFPLHGGAGSDAVHSGAEYAFAVSGLHTDTGMEGGGITLTLGLGNRLVCEAIEELGRALAGREIEELMTEFGAVSR